MNSVELKRKLPARAIFRAIQNERCATWIDRATGDGPSFMAFAPEAQLTVRADGATEIEEDGRHQTLKIPPLEAIAEFVRRGTPKEKSAEAPPHTFGYLSYDLSDLLEERMTPRRAEGNSPPLARLSRYPVVLALEPIFSAPDAPCRIVAFAADRRRLAVEVARLEAKLDSAAVVPTGKAHGQLVDHPDPAAYRSAIERALEYIAAGEVYQLNIARRLVATSAAPSPEVYLRLREEQPVPFGVYFDAGGFELLSNSPERFLRVEDDRIETKPIKGTRRRDPDPDLDNSLAQDLQTDPKERAENIMIVDLERNDLGRICVGGSVQVPSLLRTESYSTLHHLVSTVAGRLRPDATLAGILRATFPGGSITGTPKIRATQLIAELEEHPREIYTGSFFAFRSPRSFDSSILIRTIVASEGRFVYHAGGGIVADSDAEREHAEMWLKAAPFLAALGIAQEGRDEMRSQRTEGKQP